MLDFKWGKTAFGEANKAKQQMSINYIDTTQGTPFLIYFLTVFMFIKELALIINLSPVASVTQGKGRP